MSPARRRSRRTPGGARRRTASAQDPTALPVSIWVRLLKAESLITRNLRRSLPDRLTLPQYDVLTQLYRREREEPGSQGMTPSELTRRLLMTGGNVTVIVARLTRDGLVQRRRGEQDRRTIRLRLTRRGRALFERQLPRYRAAVHSMLAPLPVAELEGLRELLGRLATALEAQK